MYRLYLAHSRFLAWVGKKSSFFGHIINAFTDKAYSFKMTGYWPHFALHFKARFYCTFTAPGVDAIAKVYSV